MVALHRAILAATRGADGIRELGALESALAQPKATFDGTDLYSSLVVKAAMAVFLDLNGFAIEATVDEQEQLMLDLAAGHASWGTLTDWLQSHVSAR